MSGQTPWQTVGPFFHYALPWRGGADLVGAEDMGARPDLVPPDHFMLHPTAPERAVAGEVIHIVGRVLDGEGAPISDALVEIWQANAAGRYASPDDPRAELALDPGFTGFGRAATSAAGDYAFRTVRPGRVPGPGNSLQAPHIAVGVLGRGVIKRLVTRLYFEDEPGNEEDPILALVPEARRPTLIARREGEHRYRFDIVLHGEGESVFFDL